MESIVAEKITDIIKKRFTVSAEIIPPRNGTSLDDVFKTICSLKASDADYVSVTMGAGGSLRGGSLPIANMVQEKVGLSCLAHFVCRDYTVEEVENHLIDHYYFGIRNILALRGDPPFGLENEYKARKGSHKFAYQLVEQINRMREGKYLVRKGYDNEQSTYVDGEKIDTCIGVATYPQMEDLNLAVEHLKMKVDAGADFAVTQMVFDSEALFRFRDKVQKAGINIPIIPGFRVLKGPKMCERMEDMFKISIPESIKKPLREKKKGDGAKVGLEVSLKLIEEWKKEGIGGVHVFLMEDIETACKLVKTAHQMG